jgi:serine/threonine protein kinase
MNSIDLHLLKDALEGVRFLHSHNWIHGDLKPQNIGWMGNRSVLIDLEGAIRMNPGERVPPTPGSGGTVPYLAPEREMQAYDEGVDVWSIGLVLFQLAYGYHPWNVLKNPWRRGNELLRGGFHASYGEAVKIIQGEKEKKAMQVGDLILKMLRHPWAQGKGNNENRISIQEALEHACWPGQSDEPSTKRLRQD